MDTELETFKSETFEKAQRHRNRDTSASGNFIIFFNTSVRFGFVHAIMQLKSVYDLSFILHESARVTSS